MRSAKPERFRKGLRWYSSSRGFAVAIPNRSKLEYRDSNGVIVVLGEALAGKPFGFRVYTNSLAEHETPVRVEIMANLRRLFDHFGWRLQADPPL